jgi:hypothetical protein
VPTTWICSVVVVDTDALRRLLDLCHACIAAFGHDVGRAEVARDRLSSGMATHRDNALEQQVDADRESADASS